RRHLEPLTGLKVGIGWQGNSQFRWDHIRSIPLARFAPLGKVPGVRLISLQKYHGLEQLAAGPAGMCIEQLGEEFDSGADAFIDTAAVMESLDLVISGDTAIVHLAGALGHPAWVALRHVPEWRWLLSGAYSPWYPTLRLFRQSHLGDWAGVFAAMRAALVELRGMAWHDRA
ncbi:MAG: hypothetical protein JO184_10190, partial [Gammaproteobacteria bacterium]|nr:hypothetical protein [Gammaproteobacteria bacterium]